MHGQENQNTYGFRQLPIDNRLDDGDGKCVGRIWGYMVKMGRTAGFSINLKLVSAYKNLYSGMGAYTLLSRQVLSPGGF
jgi:hypothetical protein